MCNMHRAVCFFLFERGRRVVLEESFFLLSVKRKVGNEGLMAGEAENDVYGWMGRGRVLCIGEVTREMRACVGSSHMGWIVNLDGK